MKLTPRLEVRLSITYIKSGLKMIKIYSKNLMNPYGSFAPYIKEGIIVCLPFGTNQTPEPVVVIITHGLIKKTAKTPNSDLKKALKIMKHYLNLKAKSK